MLLLWIVLMNRWMPKGLPQEGVLLFIAGVAWAWPAAHLSGLCTWPQVVVAGILAAVLHFLVYFGPLIILMGIPLQGPALEDLFGFLGLLLLGYILALGVFRLLRAWITRPLKGKT